MKLVKLRRLEPAAKYISKRQHHVPSSGILAKVRIFHLAVGARITAPMLVH